jgi:methyl-accepting chemotaxis protein
MRFTSMVKRRKVLIDLGLQGRMVAFMYVVTLAIIAFHTWVSYQSLSDGQGPPPTGADLAQVMAIDVLITTIFMGAVIGFVGVSGSHRFAGPIYRLSQVLKNVQRGDISDRVRLRKNDLLLDFAGEFNLALANMREIVAVDRARLADAVTAIEEVRNSVPVPELRGRLESALSHLEQAMKSIRIEPGTAPGDPRQLAARLPAALAGAQGGAN